MEVSVVSHNTKFIYKGKKNLKRSILSYMELLGAKPGTLAIILTSDLYLSEINHKHLGVRNLTDVISFDFSDQSCISGDIYVSIDRVRENAKKYNEKLYDELDRVIMHGILHLIGYNDRKESEKQIMREMENKYLEFRSSIKEDYQA